MRHTSFQAHTLHLGRTVKRRNVLHQNVPFAYSDRNYAASSDPWSVDRIWPELIR
jgi:hypothetical protein